MGFGMIFSILLMIFFIIVAFIVIRSFLQSRDCTQIAIFINDLQTEVDKAWNSQSSDFPFERIIPSSLQYVCFADLGKSITGEFKDIGDDISIYKDYSSNMYLYPKEKACKLSRISMKHMDIEGMIIKNNPHCIKISNGRIKMKVVKDFKDRLVRVQPIE